MQTQMGDRLVGEKIGRAIQFQQAFKSQRPIELSKEQKKSGVGRTLFFFRTDKKAFVARKAIIGEVKRRRRVTGLQLAERVGAGKKKNIRIGVKCRAIDRQRHDQSELLSGRMRRQILADLSR